MTRRALLTALLLPTLGCTAVASPGGASPSFEPPAILEAVSLTEGEWQARLTQDQFRVMRLRETERAFSGAHWNRWDQGTYHCAACGAALYHSEAKFESGTGWPSFGEAVRPDAIDTTIDRSLGMVRTAVVCSRCGSHLGHVYDDGPAPMGLRHSLNSTALVFRAGGASRSRQLARR